MYTSISKMLKYLASFIWAAEEHVEEESEEPVLEKSQKQKAQMTSYVSAVVGPFSI